MTETARLADQIRRAFEGEAWHGDPLLKILKGINAKKAAAHPIKNAHSIWELVLHIAAWDDAVRRRALGKTAKLTAKQNFPPVHDTSEAAWSATIEHAKQVHAELVKVVAEFPDSRLCKRVPGKTQNYHNFYFMFSGVAQHELYHTGQIALLKKAQG